MKMRKKLSRTVCLLVAVIMMVAMSTTTADAASFSKAAPKGVKATCVSGVSVKVTCKAKKGAKGYYFYYATSKGGKYKLGAKSKTRTGTIKGLKAGKTYYFKVKAYKGLIKKKFTKMSKPAKCKVVLKAPAITVSTQCCCKINITMTKAAGATGFIIYRYSPASKKYVQVAKTTATTWQDTGLNELTKYYYKVRMYRGTYNAPFSAVKSATTMKDLGDGNGDEYSLDNSGTSDYKSELANRNIFFLGSSITYGSNSDGDSFPDYVARRNGLGNRSINCVSLRNNGKTPEGGNGVVWKEAVTGTTMARIKGDLQTYSFRLYKNYHLKNTEINPDVFVCQLSLNDANKNISLGSTEKIYFDKLNNEDTADAYLKQLYGKSFDVAGAIEYITALAYAKYPDCQVVFYTVSHFTGGKSAQYAKMVNLLKQEAELQKIKTEDGDGNVNKTDAIQILDLWNDPDISAWKWNVFCLYMADSHHPKRAGYLQWTPYFEKAIAKAMPPKREYTITWENEDGSVLEVDRHLKRGEKLTYDGPAPEKEASGDTTYEFIGWKNPKNGKDYSPEDIDKLIVLGDATFVAQFKEVAQVEPEPEPGTEPGSDPAEGEGSGGTGGEETGNDSGGNDGGNSDGDNNQPSGNDAGSGGSSDGQAGSGSDNQSGGGESNGSNGSSDGQSGGGSDGDSNSILDMLGITGIVESLLRAA